MSAHYAPCVMTNTDQFSVRLCGCGVVHLTFGVSAVHVSPEALVAMSDILQGVAAEIRGPQLQLTVQPEPTITDKRTSPEGSDNVVFGRFPFS